MVEYNKSICDITIDLRNGGIVGSDSCDFYEVYSIDIIDSEKVIQLNDAHGYVMGQIHYENESEVTLDNYNGEAELYPYTIDIVKNGKIVYKEGDIDANNKRCFRP